MTEQAAIVFSIIAVVAVLMASNRVRYDLIALLVVLSLVLFGILSVGEALSGFGSSVVIMVAGLLIVGEMLEKTGVARAVGDLILRRGGANETQLVILIMISAAVLGSVMSSTAVVAIFIPIILRISEKTGAFASRLLLPMSYAALISGMLTLIASPPNLVVSDELKAAGYTPLGFFSFSLVGVAVLAVAVAYIILIGPKLLPMKERADAQKRPDKSIAELWNVYRAGEVVQALRITPESQVLHGRLADLSLGTRYGIRVLLRIRHGKNGKERLSLVSSGMELRAGDILVTTGRPEDHERLLNELQMTEATPDQRRIQRWLWEVGAASVIVHPHSVLIGKSVVEAEFRSVFGLQVLGIRRAGESLDDVRDTILQAGDTLLVVGSWERIAALAERNHDFVILELPAEHKDVVPSYRKAPIALAILTAMVALSVFGVVPLVIAVIGAAVAAVLTGCLQTDQAYRSLNLSSLILVAGMLPLADALVRTGGSQLLVEQLLSIVGDAGPYVLMSLVFLLTALLGLVLSNTASAVLVAPIAIELAEILEVSPYPMAIAVLVAASAAYSTPVSTPVVTLVVAPGGYKFGDFIKLGIPLLLLTWIVTLILAPLVFPFTG